jgi:hypothetical protein
MACSVFPNAGGDCRNREKEYIEKGMHAISMLQEAFGLMLLVILKGFAAHLGCAIHKDCKNLRRSSNKTRQPVWRFSTEPSEAAPTSTPGNYCSTHMFVSLLSFDSQFKTTRFILSTH